MRPLDAPDPVRFTTTDVVKMVDAGILRPDDKVELIHGELIRLSPKHYRHERIKLGLTRLLARGLPDSLALGVETTLYLEDNLFLEPDLHVFPNGYRSDAVPGPEVMLAIEAADTTLDYDLHIKAPIYAAHGVQRLWVVDAVRDITHVHEEPTAEGYGRVRLYAADEALPLPFAPELCIKLQNIPSLEDGRPARRSKAGAPPGVNGARRGGGSGGGSGSR